MHEWYDRFKTPLSLCIDSIPLLFPKRPKPTEWGLIGRCALFFVWGR